MPKVLAFFPAVSPTVGKKALPKREGASARVGRASFVSDVLDALGVPAIQDAEANSQAAASSAAGPLEPRQAREVSEETLRHEWHWQAGRWLCTACLTTSRLPVPSRGGKCAGMSSNLASLVQNPRGHTWQVATFADGNGVVVVCSRCGHYSTSNRPCELHKKACKAKGGQAAFASPGVEIAYERIASGKHPKHAKGEAKVLDPCMPLETLRRAAERELEG